METLEAINSRHSIRKYLKDDVSNETVNILLKAAMSAPSAGNAQPWEFIVIKDKGTRKQMAAIHPHARIVEKAPVAIFIIGNTGKEIYPGYWPQDCSAATENLLLAAHDIGLGAVWCGIYPTQERWQAFSQMFALPQELVPFALVPVGYPDQQVAPQDRFDPTKVHYEKW